MSQEKKTKQIGIWVLVGLCSLGIVVPGVGKLVGMAPIVKSFQHLGYSDGFRYFIGVCETAGAIGLLIPRLTTLAAIGLNIIMAGAVYSLVAAGDPFGKSVPAIALFVLFSVLAVARWPQSILNRSGSGSGSGM